MDLSLAHSPRRIEAPATMESLTMQLRYIQLNLDILYDHMYEDCNEIVAYINDIWYDENKILE